MVYTEEQWKAGSAIFLGIWFGVPAFFFLLYLMGRCRIVESGTAVVIERFGRYDRTVDAGLCFLLPFVENTKQVVWRHFDVYQEKQYGRSSQRTQIRQVRTDIIDLREALMDMPSQQVITRDNVQLDVHPMLLYRIVNATRAAYECYDLCHAVEKLVQATLRR